MLVATIDTGTNSVKLLIAEVRPPRIRTLVEQVVVTRLGEGVSRSGRIGKRPAERTFLQLAAFRDLIREHPVEKACLGGTRVFRAAENGEEVLREWKRALDIPARILSGREEARLAYLGASPEGRSTTAIDIGGGSTEISRGKNGVLSRSRSLDIGAVTVMEDHLQEAPSTSGQVSKARTAIRSRLKRLPPPSDELVGVGGTISTALGVSLRRQPTPKNIHQGQLTRDTITRLLNRLLSMPVEKRLLIRGLGPGRADILPSGLLILDEYLGISNQTSLRVSAHGLRHGLALHLASA